MTTHPLNLIFSKILFAKAAFGITKQFGVLAIKALAVAIAIVVSSTYPRFQSFGLNDNK